MIMISIEPAQKLKKFGIAWTPQPGDFFNSGNAEGIFVSDGNRIPDPDDVWLPRLDQLLSELNVLTVEYKPS